MVNYLIELSGSEHSGFYLSDLNELRKKINFLKASGHNKVMLWGVTFALLEFANNYAPNMENMIIIETGGMKGRGEEIVRADLYEQLMRNLKTSSINHLS